MAYFKKIPKGWTAQLCVGKVRIAKTFAVKAQAIHWAAKKETELRALGGKYTGGMKTFSDLAQKYRNEVSSAKKGVRWEVIRINAMLKNKVIGGLSLIKLNSNVMSQWRDARLKEVSPASVLREMGLLSDMFNVAVNEWGVMMTNPLKGIKRPKHPKARDRIPSDEEVGELIAEMGWNNTTAKTIIDRVAICVLFAIETGMRSGEILALKRKDIRGAVAVLRESKTGKGREVPLSKRAVELLSYLPTDDLFDMDDSQRDSNFRKYRAKCGESHDYTFHDLRHKAITNLSKKLPVLELARMVGHTNLKQLMTYYNPKAEDLAKLLG